MAIHKTIKLDWITKFSYLAAFVCARTRDKTAKVGKLKSLLRTKLRCQHLQAGLHLVWYICKELCKYSSWQWWCWLRNASILKQKTAHPDDFILKIFHMYSYTMCRKNWKYLWQETCFDPRSKIDQPRKILLPFAIPSVALYFSTAPQGVFIGYYTPYTLITLLNSNLSKKEA